MFREVQDSQSLAKSVSSSFPMVCNKRKHKLFILDFAMKKVGKLATFNNKCKNWKI